MKRRKTQAELDNLKKGKATQFTSETARENGRKGGYAAAEANRRRKAVAEYVCQIGAAPVQDDEQRQILAELGITDEVVQNDAMIAAGLYYEARSGNVTAIEKWEEMVDRVEGQAFENLTSADDRALALARAHYLENINSSFGAISVYALKHRYTHYEASGGRGSGKSSWASLTVVRLVMENPDVHALVLRKVGNTLRDSVYSQYLWAIEQLGVSEFWEARKSPLELIYLPTGQKILFRGADDPMKIKSIKMKFGYIGITHFEEKDQFSGLGEAFYEEAESLRERDEGRYQHEYLGVPVGTGGSVFENLELRVITDEELSRFDHIFQGVDWGWFPDPYAFVRLHYDKTRETIYLIDEHFGNRISNEQGAGWILEHGYNDVQTVCDSADPKSIADYRSQGIRAKEAVKGPNSVEYGMKWLQNRTIVIDKRRTPHAYEEFVNYEFEKNRQDEWISGYPDKNNHTIDAVRYALERAANKFGSKA